MINALLLYAAGQERNNMSKYNVGDKFIIEIAEGIKGYGNDPNMPDPLNMPVLYRIKGFNALVFDEFGLNKLQKVEEEKYPPSELFKLHQKAFEEGMQEAWKMAKLIASNADEGGIPLSIIREEFNCDWNDIFAKFTPQETKVIIEKIEKINVGDVVTDGHVTMLVTGIGGESGLLFLLGKDGEIMTRQKPELFTKTGRTLDIQTILSKIECDEDLPFD